MKRKIELEIPEEILISLKETADEFKRHLLLLGAVKLYQMRKLSSGQASELADMPRIAFFHSLSEFKVPLSDLTREELAEDLKNA